MPMKIANYVLVYHIPIEGAQVASFATEGEADAWKRRVAARYGVVLKAMTGREFYEALGIDGLEGG